MGHTETIDVARANMNDAKCEDFGISILMDTGYDRMKVEFLDGCPLCGVSFQMGGINLRKSIHSFMGLEDMKGEILCVHRCPSCRKLFVTKHVRAEKGKPMKQVSVWPEPTPNLPDYVDGIKGLSPRFVELYQSARRLENLEMTDVVGNVYRMALECLVKDYAMMKHPEDDAKIAKMSLCEAINTYFGAQPQVQNLGNAVRKLGNDYTHYVHDFDESNLIDMNLLLTAVGMAVYQELLLNALQPMADKYTKKGGV